MNSVKQESYVVLEIKEFKMNRIGEVKNNYIYLKKRNKNLNF
jgi:hypothetical protein